MIKLYIPAILAITLAVVSCQSPSGTNTITQDPMTETIIGTWATSSYTIKDGVDVVQNDDGTTNKGYDLVANQTSLISDIAVQLNSDGTGSFAYYTTISSYGSLEGILPAEYDERNYERNGSCPPRWYAIMQFEWMKDGSVLTIKGTNGSSLGFSVSNLAYRVGDASKTLNHSSTHNQFPAMKGSWKTHTEDIWGGLASLSAEISQTGSTLTTKLFSLTDQSLVFHRQ